MADSSGRAPWHFWVAAVVALLLSANSCYDYYITQIGHFDRMPAWVTAAWATCAWSALLGSILLLFRSKWAFHVLVVSFGAGVLHAGFVIWKLGEAVGYLAIFFGVGAITSLFFVWYARFATKRGILR